MRRVVPAALALLGLLLVYALAAGPAVNLMQRRVLDQEWVSLIFLAPESPLQLAVNAVPGGERLFHWYIAWWEVLDAGGAG